MQSSELDFLFGESCIFSYISLAVLSKDFLSFFHNKFRQRVLHKCCCNFYNIQVRFLMEKKQGKEANTFEGDLQFTSRVREKCEKVLFYHKNLMKNIQKKSKFTLPDFIVCKLFYSHFAFRAETNKKLIFLKILNTF